MVPTTVTEPDVGVDVEVMVNASSFGSPTYGETSSVRSESVSVEAATFEATGAPFSTTMSTVDVANPPRPSETV